MTQCVCTGRQAPCPTRAGAHQLEQALLEVVVVLALAAHELRDGVLLPAAAAQLGEVERPQLVQLPAETPMQGLSECRHSTGPLTIPASHWSNIVAQGVAHMTAGIDREDQAGIQPLPHWLHCLHDLRRRDAPLGMCLYDSTVRLCFNGKIEVQHEETETASPSRRAPR